MPRFVILTHDHPFLHWDFMLECGGTLRTWRLLELPDVKQLAAGCTVSILAEALPDHRREYLDYEGPVSGGRGEVRQWDAGTFTNLDSPAGLLSIQLCGSKLNYPARLVETKVGEDLKWEFG